MISPGSSVLHLEFWIEKPCLVCKFFSISTAIVHVDDLLSDISQLTLDRSGSYVVSLELDGLGNRQRCWPEGWLDTSREGDCPALGFVILCCHYNPRSSQMTTSDRALPVLYESLRLVVLLVGMVSEM